MDPEISGFGSLAPARMTNLLAMGLAAGDRAMWKRWRASEVRIMLRCTPPTGVTDIFPTADIEIGRG